MVVVEDVHIIQAQAFQRLVEAGEQVRAAAEVAIGACPHFIAGLGGDDEFVAVMFEILGEQQSAVLLGLAGLGAVVVGQVEVGDAVVEGGEDQGLHLVEWRDVAEVVPEAE